LQKETSSFSAKTIEAGKGSRVHPTKVLSKAYLHKAWVAPLASLNIHEKETETKSLDMLQISTMHHNLIASYYFH
jgi:hypothetical protein